MAVRGRKNRGLSEQYKHICIFITPSDWDKLNFYADGENKSVSRWLVDKVLSSDQEPKEYVPTETRCAKSLCMKIDEHEKIKARAEKAGMSVSNYILGIIL